MISIRLKFSQEDLARLTQVVAPRFSSGTIFNQDYVVLVYDASPDDLEKWKSFIHEETMVIINVTDETWDRYIQAVQVGWKHDGLNIMFPSDTMHYIPISGIKGMKPIDCYAMITNKNEQFNRQLQSLNFSAKVVAEVH